MIRRPSASALVAPLTLLLTAGPACGKKGDPRPPLRPTPAAITGLRLAQRGDQVEIGFVAPRASTDGARLPVLDIELFVAQGDGEFLKIAGARRFKAAPGEALNETEPLPPPGTTLRVAARALAKGHKGSLPEPARLLVVAPLSPPTELAATVVGEGVALAWQGELPNPLPTPEPKPVPTPAATPTPTAPPPAGPPSSQTPGPPPTTLTPPPVPPAAGGVPSSPSQEAPSGPIPTPTPTPTPTPKPTPEPFTPGFFIYRRTATGSYGPPLAPAATTEHTFVDRTAQPGESLCYVVRAAASAEPLVESAASGESCVEVKDVLAPAAPAGVAAIARDEGIEVSWSPSPEADLGSYRVYRRARQGGGEARRLAELPATETTFLDKEPPPGALFYSVTAVDRAGNESPPTASTEARRP